MSIAVQRGFARGEISTRYGARSDLTAYQLGLRTARNVTVSKDGALENRMGTEFIAEVKDSSRFTRAVEFEFNEDDQTYALEFGDGYIRFHYQGVPVSVSGVSQWTASVYSLGQVVVHDGIFYTYKVLNPLVSLEPPDSTQWHAMTDEIYEIYSPYGEADLPGIKFVQNADVMTLNHPDYPPFELQRYENTRWAMWNKIFAPGIDAVTGLQETHSAGTGTYKYAVTAVSGSGEESAPAEVTATSADLDTSTSIDLEWDENTDAVRYNIYRQDGTSGGLFLFIAAASSTVYQDFAGESDPLQALHFIPGDFSATGDHPAAIGQHQQRMWFAGTDNDPQAFWATRAGTIGNLYRHIPIEDDDAFTHKIRGQKVSRIKHIVSAGGLYFLTDSAEFEARGSGGIVTPTEINLEQRSANGAGDVAPLSIGASAIYVQTQGSSVHEIGTDIASGGRDGYTDDDLTLFASHLLKNKTITAWAYQKKPNPIVWAVRSDGVLLGMTYNKRQEILAWHRHDFGGDVESVACVPEGNEYFVYIIIKREIDGEETRYLERMASRQFDDIADAAFMDSFLTYDGRNEDEDALMKLYGPDGWAEGEELTLQCITDVFNPDSPGNEVQLNGVDDDGEDITIRCEILRYVSESEVIVRADTTIPETFQEVSVSDWAVAVDEIDGLEHLEGETVSVFADGVVIGSPNNPAYSTYTIVDGALTPDLPRPYAVVHVGLPITADIETLDLDTAQGESFANKQLLVNKLTAFVEDTQGVFFGSKPPDDDDIDPLQGLKQMRYDGAYVTDDSLASGKISVAIDSSWNNNGRVFLRQVDPLPVTILGLVPEGFLPYRG